MCIPVLFGSKQDFQTFQLIFISGKVKVDGCVWSDSIPWIIPNSQFFLLIHVISNHVLGQDHRRQSTRTHVLRLYMCWYIKLLPCLLQSYCQQTSLPHTQYKHERKVWKCPSNYLWDSASYLGYSCSSQDLKGCWPTNLPPWLSVSLKLYHLLFSQFISLVWSYTIIYARAGSNKILWMMQGLPNRYPFHPPCWPIGSNLWLVQWQEFEQYTDMFEVHTCNMRTQNTMQLGHICLQERSYDFTLSEIVQPCHKIATYSLELMTVINGSVAIVWTPDPSSSARKVWGKTLPGSVLSAGMLPLVLMRERSPVQPTSVPVLLMRGSEYMVKHRAFENGIVPDRLMVLKIWKRKFVELRNCGITARHFCWVIL